MVGGPYIWRYGIMRGRAMRVYGIKRGRAMRVHGIIRGTAMRVYVYCVLHVYLIIYFTVC